VNHEHRALQVLIRPFKESRDVVAIFRVVGHDEKDRLLAELFVLVIENGQFLDVAHNHAQIDLAVGGPAGRSRAKKVVHRVVVVHRRNGFIAGVNAVDVRQEDVPGFVDDADFVLNVQGQLKIVAPVAAVESVFGQDGIVKEDLQALEVLVNAVKDDDVRSDDEKVERQPGIGFVQLVEETPGESQAEHLGLPAPVAILITKRRQDSSNIPVDTAPELSKRIRSYLSLKPTTS
jgi:hypothetical protein